MGPTGWVSYQSTFVLVVGSLFAGGGLLTAATGLLFLWLAPVRAGTMSTFRQRWGLGPDVDDATLRYALRILARIRGWSLFLAGAGMTLVVVGEMAGVWLVTGSFLLTTMFHGWALVIPALIVILLLGSVGQADGVRRLRARARHQPAQGDVRPRRLRDYVPGWVGVAFGAWALAAVLLTLAALPFAHVPLRSQLDGGQWVYIPLGRWALLVTPALMVACLALGIALLRWMVALPRLKSVDGLVDAGTFDLLFRRESIIVILLQGAQVMFVFSTMGWSTALDNLPLGVASAVLAIVGLAIFATYLALSLALGTFARTGAAGGAPRRDQATVTV